MAGVQVTVAITALEEQRRGFMALTLSDFLNDVTEPLITLGSVVEIAGALYIFNGNEAITGFGAIATSTTAYIELTASGASVTAAWTTTAPAWDSDKQGFYNGALVRTIGAVFKDGSSNAAQKRLFLIPNNFDGFRFLGTGELSVPALTVIGAAVAAAGLTVAAGNLVATAGDITATAGDITATAGDLSAGGGRLILLGADPVIDTPANEPLLLDSGRKPNAILFAVVPTENTVYDFASPFIGASNGDRIIVSGGWALATRLRATAWAERVSASRIDFESVDDVTLNSRAANNGSGSSFADDAALSI